MNRIFKAATALACALCLAAGVLLMAACGGDSYKYTVNILYPDGKGAQGIEITLSPKDGKAYDDFESGLVAVTDENGKAEFDISKWTDTSSYTVTVNQDNIPEHYSLQQRHEIDLKDGYALKLTLTQMQTSYDTVNVKLASKEQTYEYEPWSGLEDGFYEFRCSNSEVKFTLTDGDEDHPATFNLTEGYNTVLVYYNKGDIYDIGTANEETEFNVVFSAVKTDGKTVDGAHEIETGKAMVLKLGTGEKVYLNNPAEIDIPGTQGGGTPCSVTGTNFKISDEAASGKISSGKTVEVSTADGSAGTVVLTFEALSNTAQISVGETKTIEIELAERTITTQNGTSATIRWTTNTCRLQFNIEEEGQYKFTFKSEYTGDLLYVYSIISTGLIPVVPERTDLIISDSTGEFKPSDKSANPYIAVYKFTKANLNTVKSYNVDFATEISNFDTFKIGDKITYTVKLEKI